MSPTYDLAVIGSGIVGLGAAYAGLERGLRVVVIDRAAEIGGATIRNFGHACITAQVGEALRYGLSSRDRWLRLSCDAGFWARESGTLIAARHDDELALLEAFVADPDPLLQDPGLPDPPLPAPSLAGLPSPRILAAGEVRARAPLADPRLVGGALLPADVQVNPREAGPAIAAHLAARGVEFRMRTAATSVSPGRVETSRGPIHAGTVVVAVNHDIDQLYPELAERSAVVRCGLDMLRVRADLPAPLSAPLLTGWSLLRYSAFATRPEAAAVRRRLHAERPDLAALDLNQMYTQLPDGTLLVGDTHYRGAAVTPFQSEAAAEALLAEARDLFGTDALRVLERWQGVYASGPEEFLRDEPEPGVLVASATTGIGMTTGLGFAESVLADHLS